MHKLYEERVKNLIVSMGGRVYHMQLANDREIAEFLLCVTQEAEGDIKVGRIGKDVVHTVSLTQEDGTKFSVVIVEGILLPGFIKR